MVGCAHEQGARHRREWGIHWRRAERLETYVVFAHLLRLTAHVVQEGDRASCLE